MCFLELPAERATRSKEAAQVLILSKKLTNFLYNEKIISDADKEVVEFGIESLIGNLLGFMMTLGVGFLFKQFVDALILWIMLFPLRKTVGGYHASSRCSCFFSSLAMLILSAAIFTRYGDGIMIYVICSIITSSMVWLFAPVENFSKKLDQVEYKVYKVRSRKIVIVEVCMLAAALLCQWLCVARGIGMAFFITSISILAGKLSVK